MCQIVVFRYISFWSQFFWIVLFHRLFLTVNFHAWEIFMTPCFKYLFYTFCSRWCNTKKLYSNVLTPPYLVNVNSYADKKSMISVLLNFEANVLPQLKESSCHFMVSYSLHNFFQKTANVVIIKSFIVIEASCSTSSQWTSQTCMP